MGDNPVTVVLAEVPLVVLKLVQFEPLSIDLSHRSQLTFELALIVKLFTPMLLVETDTVGADLSNAVKVTLNDCHEESI